MNIVPGLLVILLTVLAVFTAITAGLLALSVVLSFAVSWYERVNSDPAVDGQRRHALAVQLMLTEFACLLMTLLLRPLGWLPARFPAGPGKRPPVILLHGLFQNRSCLWPLAWRLRTAGFDCIISINTPPWHDLETLTDRLAAAVARARAVSGSPRVHLVGHSMGGMIARNFLIRPGQSGNVTGCVTIGTPHRGSKLAPFAVSRLGRSLLPGSELLTRLNAASLPTDVSFTVIYSRHDNIIVPVESARLEGVRNVELAELGHTTMLFSPKVAREVVAALENPAEQQKVHGQR